MVVGKVFLMNAFLLLTRLRFGPARPPDRAAIVNLQGGTAAVPVRGHTTNDIARYS
jgi:hypothetical protein